MRHWAIRITVTKKTTIPVQRDLVAKLKQLKRELLVGSYDEVIRCLLREHRRLPKSAFGRFPDLPSFQRDEIDRFD